MSFLPAIELLEVDQPTMGGLKLRLSAPFHPDLVNMAEGLNGKWGQNTRAWYFANDKLFDVREMCQQLWGVDPVSTQLPDLVHVDFELNMADFTQSKLWLFGRQVLVRPTSVSLVTAGVGVTIYQGGFAPKGATSVEYIPKIGYPKPETKLLIRDIPRSFARVCLNRYIALGRGEILERDQDKAQARDVDGWVDKLAGEMVKMDAQEQDRVVMNLLRIAQERKRIFENESKKQPTTSRL